MTSGETAAGKYPVETIKQMASICSTADSERGLALPPLAELAFREMQGNSRPEGVKTLVPSGWGHSMADAACAAAANANADAIVVITNTGYMAKLISKLRPEIKIIAVTGNRSCYRWVAFAAFFERSRRVDTIHVLLQTNVLVSGGYSRLFKGSRARKKPGCRNQPAN